MVSMREEAVDVRTTESFPAETTVGAGVNAPVKEEPTNESGLLNEAAGVGVLRLWAEFPLDPNAD